MSWTLIILGTTATIGAVDVGYYHLHRFRLFAQASSVLEETTHLVRHATFIALVALLASGSSSPWVDGAILSLLALDLANSAIDVALEPASRAPLGGLPRGEYVVHFLSTFGMGLATAAYLFERAARPLAPPEGLFAVQVGGMIALGIGLFLVEATLFARALSRRTRLVVA